MNHVRYVYRTFRFTPLSEIEYISIPELNKAFLLDIQISFGFIPEYRSPLRFAATENAEISNLRFELAGRDISSALRGQLLDHLEVQEQAALRQSYKLGMENLLRLAYETFPPYGTGIEYERAVAQDLAQRSWRDLIAKLGNSGAGHRGNLHPLSFLFREIPATPLSTREILFPNAEERDTPYAELQKLQLAVVRSPSILRGETRQKVGDHNRIWLELALVYKDPLEDEIVERLGRIEEAQKKLTRDVLSINDRLSEYSDDLRDASSRFVMFETTVRKLESSFAEFTKLKPKNIEKN